MTDTTAVMQRLSPDDLADAFWMAQTEAYWWRTAEEVVAYLTVQARLGRIVTVNDGTSWIWDRVFVPGTEGQHPRPETDESAWLQLPAAVHDLELGAYQAEVIRLINAAGIEGVTAEGWGDSAGQTIKVYVGGIELCSSLSIDSHTPCWTTFDCCDRERYLVSQLDLQVRPYDHPTVYGTSAGTPREMVDEILLFCRAVLGLPATEEDHDHG